MPPAPARRARTVWFMALPYLGAVLIAAVAFLAWRVVVHHRTFAARTFFWLGDVHTHDDAIGLRMRADRRGTAVLKHGIDDPARRIPVRTDAYGLRIPMAATMDPVPAGGITAIGCSCTFGHGVAAESTYVALAGELLQLPASNLGVCGYSGVTSLLLLEDHIARLRPAIVVYGCGNFHLERAANPRVDATLWQAHAVVSGDEFRIMPPAFGNRRTFHQGPRIEALYYAPRLAGRPTPFTPSRLATLLPIAVEELGRTVRPASWRLRGAPDPLPEAPFYRFLLARMHAVTAAHGARFVVLYFPASFGERPAPDLASAATEFASRPDFLFLDAGPRLFEDIADQAEYAARWQVPRDGHPNRFMHLEMARALADTLRPGVRGGS